MCACVCLCVYVRRETNGEKSGVDTAGHSAEYSLPVKKRRQQNENENDGWVNRRWDIKHVTITTKQDCHVWVTYFGLNMRTGTARAASVSEREVMLLAADSSPSCRLCNSSSLHGDSASTSLCINQSLH